MMDHRRRSQREVGNLGEEIALLLLSGKGLQLVARNYRCKGGELDLVMLDGATLALIEVRFRADDSYGGAAASITPAKQRRLVIAAKHFLVNHPKLARLRARFDVIAMDR